MRTVSYSTKGLKEFSPVGKTWGSNIIHTTDKDLPGLKFRFIVESLRDKFGLTLEVGCSAGKMLRSLGMVRPDITYFGCDIDDVSVHKGHRITSDIGFVVGDGLDLPFRDKTFDAIIINNYLEHVSDARRAMGELERVLKKNGIISGFVPCQGNMLSPYYIFRLIFGFNFKEPVGGDVQFFTSDDVIHIAREKKLGIKKVEYSYHFLGAIFDFVFFLMVYLSHTLADTFWKSNKYYQDGSRAWINVGSRLMNSALQIGNMIAYLESRMLHNVKASACGIHFVARKYAKDS